MTTPFPGMNPWLEGETWRDFHQSFSATLREVLNQLVGEDYYVRVEPYIVVSAPTSLMLGYNYPDVAVLKEKSKLSEPFSTYQMGNLTPPTISIKGEKELLKVPELKLYHQKTQQLITAIEVLSPANKYGKELKKYRQKVEDYLAGGVHVIEVDLLRRGSRPFPIKNQPDTPYYISLWRGETLDLEKWAIELKDKLPTIPVPRKMEDEDVVLNLQEVFDLNFKRSGYAKFLNYDEKPPAPEFSATNHGYIKECLDNFKKP